MKFTAALVTLTAGWLLALAQPAAQAERFDTVVRADFVAGFAGDMLRLESGMRECERVLAANPNHAEALVWHGSGLAYQAGQAFGRNELDRGMDLWTRGLNEMNRAVALAPDDVGVRIPRGATLLTASRSMPGPQAAALLEQGLADYERVLAIQEPTFRALGDHPKGELLFGLAEGFSRLGRTDKARLYFERLVSDAPGSGQSAKARQWLDSGTLPPAQGLGCVGCHR